MPKAAAGGVPQEGMFLEISQNLQENTCARASFLISCRPVFFAEDFDVTASEMP